MYHALASREALESQSVFDKDREGEGKQKRVVHAHASCERASARWPRRPRPASEQSQGFDEALCKGKEGTIETHHPVDAGVEQAHLLVPGLQRRHVAQERDAVVLRPHVPPLWLDLSLHGVHPPLMLVEEVPLGGLVWVAAVPRPSRVDERSATDVITSLTSS